jgi:uncharacterized membrane protein YphA (DoxX/SURF4 family)
MAEPSTEADLAVALLEAAGVDVALLVRVALLAEVSAGTLAAAGVAAKAGVLGASVVGLEALFGAPAAHATRKITNMASRQNLGRSNFREERLSIRSTYLVS